MVPREAQVRHSLPAVSTGEGRTAAERLTTPHEGVK
jgi:hypothetical protein